MWQENKERTTEKVKTFPISTVSSEEIESGSLYFYLLDQPKGTSTILSPHYPIVTEGIILELIFMAQGEIMGILSNVEMYVCMYVCSFWLTRIYHIWSLWVERVKIPLIFLLNYFFFSLHHRAAPFLYLSEVTSHRLWKSIIQFLYSSGGFFEMMEAVWAI